MIPTSIPDITKTELRNDPNLLGPKGFFVNNNLILFIKKLVPIDKN